MNLRNTFIGLLALTASVLVMADTNEIELNPQHPTQYIVAAGDTLWGIADKFLKNPWQWPDLWESKDNRPLRPGDVLSLIEIDGKPRLRLNVTSNATNITPRRPGQPLPVVKLSPNIRASAMTDEIPIIPINTIHGFLSSPKVVSEQELDDAPYVLGFTDQHIVAGTDEKIYVRGLEGSTLTTYGLYHKGGVFQDSETGEELGCEAVHVGEVNLLQNGDPATFMLVHALREAREGDRLLRLEEERLPTFYVPHAPKSNLRGHILGVMGSETVGGRINATHIGQYSVVVVDRGKHDGLEIGHVLTIRQKSRTISDKFSGKAYDTADMPEEDVGSLLIFRPFERVSFGLVMKTTRGLFAGDVVQTP